MLLFNANDSFYKYPAGAVENGTNVLFRVGVSRRDSVLGVYLMFSEDKKEAEKIRMSFEYSDGGIDYYCHTVSLLRVGIYWYTFIVEKKNGEIVFGRKNDGLPGSETVKAWQQTVYKKGWSAASSFAGKIIYQIFPDRFYKSETFTVCLPERKKYAEFKKSNELPNYMRDKNGNLDTDDFFGGNLRGIEEKLDYIKSLGAGIIYLNPIFESHSNHRYDTSDYMKIDPILGDDDALSSLCEKARKKGIRIILDGVFSHTGNDSVYFNEYGTYDSVGAYQSKDSPYFKWYTFQRFPDEYSAWWGIKILPEVKETEPDYLNFITGRGGVLEKWLSLGASGFRLDVADELPDEFLDALYKTVKANSPDSYVVGEVWEDATSKEGFGKRRKYLLGEQMDGVMNYVLKDAVIEYLLSENAERVANAMELLSENYPRPALNCLMNILGSHDTKRILSVLGGYTAADDDFEGQAKERLSPEAREKAVKLLKIGYFLLATLPGCPTIYYGDEIGMEGLRDPLNRKYFEWDNIDTEIYGHFSLMGRIRNENPELQSGEYKTLYAKDSLFAFSRETLTVVANCGEKEMEITFDYDMKELISGKNLKSGKHSLLPYSFLLLRKK